MEIKRREAIPLKRDFAKLNERLPYAKSCMGDLVVAHGCFVKRLFVILSPFEDGKRSIDLLQKNDS
jgi:hypothetical protein